MNLKDYRFRGVSLRVPPRTSASSAVKQLTRFPSRLDLRSHTKYFATTGKSVG